MADPAYNGGGLIGFDETTTGGNTNSGNNSSTPNPPKSPPPPIPTPPKQSNPPQPKPQKTILDELSSVSKPITPSKKPASKNIREIFNKDTEVVEKQIVGNFEEDGFIRLSGKYPQNYVDIPKYDLSKINVISNPEVTFDFILCLKDGKESIPKLYATKIFYDILISEYNNNKPFGVNDIIEEKNIVVVDIKPLKEKIEVMRNAELSINLNRNEINGQVEVKRHLFSYSNYDVGEDGVLIANPTYDFLELLKYISWVVSKPAANYDDRLIPATDLGDFQSFTEETADEDEPSNKVDDKVDDNDNPADPSPNLYPPIGRKGVEPGETVLFNGDYFEWDSENEIWNRTNSDDDRSGGGGRGGDDMFDRD